MSSPALEYRDLAVSFALKKGLAAALSGGPTRFNAVDRVNLSVGQGEIVGVVGESGSGKTTLSKAALGLVDIAGGDIRLFGRPVDHSTLRGGEIQMVFQDPLSSLNPRQKVREALATPLLLHGRANRKSLDQEIDALLKQVGLPIKFRDRFPHELSGGQLQRVAIARALSTKPKVLFADEAVSKLDVSVRAQILNLLKWIRETYALTIIFVTHDLHVARFLCDRIAVMYFGKLVETGKTSDVFSSPAHPYTRELIGTLDARRGDSPAEAHEAFNPSKDSTEGCRFLKRCGFSLPACRQAHPETRPISSNHTVACNLFDDLTSARDRARDDGICTSDAPAEERSRIYEASA